VHDKTARRRVVYLDCEAAILCRMMGSGAPYLAAGQFAA